MAEKSMDLVEFIMRMNYGTILMIVLLFVAVIFSKSIEKKIRWYFIGMVICLIILVIVDGFDYYIKYTYKEYVFWREVTTATGYAVRPIVGYFLVLVVCRNRDIKLKHYFSIPLIINAILAFTSIKTDWMFDFDAYNEFSREVFWPLPFALGLFYAVLTIVTSILENKRIGKTEQGIIKVVVISFLSGTMIEAMFDYKFLLNISVLCGTYVYYLILHMQIYVRDSLTDLFNRQYMEKNLENKNNSEYILIIFDINNLKYINDTFGHSAGDNYIKNCVNTVLKCIKYGDVMYRIGGDEFIIICKNRSDEVIHRLIKNIKFKLYQSETGAAFGWHRHLPGESLDYAINEADKMMYSDKKNSKKNTLVINKKS